ncbi:Abi-alpha family protein [Rhodococcus tukisamuensis]|uniref:DUF4393 domain-containing protein n=1 Tax=Rhodococcus tukisamuensis TaxID=168276 RepID=A0A1G7DNU3_9NOCA|nr:Abi-alpha family protein [Rhodococcus tukisamuensis]SDE52816.1 protein of unknown function [Rhodococcus tukisamuensis]
MSTSEHQYGRTDGYDTPAPDVFRIDHGSDGREAAVDADSWAGSEGSEIGVLDVHDGEVEVGGFTDAEFEDGEVHEGEVLEPARSVPVEERLIRSLIGLTTATAVTSLRLTGWVAGTAAVATRQIVQAASEAAEAAKEGARQPLERQEPRLEPVRSQRRVRTPSRAGSASRTTPRKTTADGLAELRARGDQLLERSADVRDSDDLHPAYDRILDQLAPDEARVLRLLATSGPQPSVDIRTGRPFGVGSEMVGEGLSMIGELAGCRHVDRTHAYLHNLHRLGLVAFSRDAVDLDRYQVVEVQPAIVEAVKKAGRSAKVVRRSVHLTSFGSDFCQTCFSLPGKGAVSPVL